MSQFTKEVHDYLQNSKMMRKSFENNFGQDIKVTPELAKLTYRMYVGRDDKCAAHDFIVKIAADTQTTVTIMVYDDFNHNMLFNKTVFCMSKQTIRTIVNRCDTLCRYHCCAAHQLGLLDELT
jgi:hypothetical protein